MRKGSEQPANRDSVLLGVGVTRWKRDSEEPSDFRGTVWIVEGSLGSPGAGGILSAEKVAEENSPRLASSLTLAVSPRRVDGLRIGTLGSEDRVGDAWGC